MASSSLDEKMEDHCKSELQLLITSIRDRLFYYFSLYLIYAIYSLDFYSIWRRAFLIVCFSAVILLSKKLYEDTLWLRNLYLNMESKNEKKSKSEPELKVVKDEEEEEKTEVEKISKEDEEKDELKRMNIQLEEDNEKLLSRVERATKALELYHGIVEEFIQQWLEDKLMISEQLREIYSTTVDEDEEDEETNSIDDNDDDGGEEEEGSGKSDLETIDDDEEGSDDDDEEGSDEEGSDIDDEDEEGSDDEEEESGSEGTEETDSASVDNPIDGDIIKVFSTKIDDDVVEAFEAEFENPKTWNTGEYLKRVMKLEEKFRKSEEERIQLWGALNEARASAEVYRSILHNTFS